MAWSWQALSIAVLSSLALWRTAKATEQHLVFVAKSSWEGTIIDAKNLISAPLPKRLIINSRNLNNCSYILEFE